MKFTKNIFVLLSVATIILFGTITTKSVKKTANSKDQKQVHVIRDISGFSTELGTVVRRDPTVTTVTRTGNYRLQPTSSTISMSNSNTSTLPNVGFLGRTAEIVNPHVVMHSKTPVSVIKETPAHLGWRNEQKTITSLNLDSGRTEQHTINEKSPIYGNIQEVKTIYKNDVKSYDIANKRFSPTVTTFTHE